MQTSKLFDYICQHEFIMQYHLRDHTADIAVESIAPTLEEAFAGIAEGLASAHSDDPLSGGAKFNFTISSESLESLLFDFLATLIYERDIYDVLPINHTVQIEQNKTNWSLSSVYHGVPISSITSREIKAVTYSDMAIERIPSGWKLYVVFDV